MKKLSNLKGVKTLNKKEQKDVYGGRKFSIVPVGGGGSGACQVGCAGLSHGDECFATGTSPNCSCPGRCYGNGGVCSPF